MNGKGKTALLAGLLAATMQEEEKNRFIEFSNPYSELPLTTYKGYGNNGYIKSQLTKKQKKIRAKNKAARKQRKRNR